MSAVLRMIARLPLFQGMTQSELQLLESILRARHLRFGETLFSEGDRARNCFVLVAGEINVLKRMLDNRDEHLATLRPGSVVGHMALIDNRPRSATCVAGAKSMVLELAGDDFDRLFRANNTFAFKILDHVASDLVLRLRLATERLTAAATAQTPQKKRISVREAAEALLAGRSADFDGVDLDRITFTIDETSRKDYRK